VPDVQHTVEVTAESLYEAVAKALIIFRQNAWVADIGTGMTPVTVVVKEPAVRHQVLMKDFDRWLKRTGRSPAETASRSALRKQLGL
jgi:actin-like ATPase involved in cell morphogenesis